MFILFLDLFLDEHAMVLRYNDVVLNVDKVDGWMPCYVQPSCLSNSPVL